MLFLLESLTKPAYCFKITFMRFRVNFGRPGEDIIRCTSVALQNVFALLLVCVPLFAWHPAEAAGRRSVASQSTLAAGGANFAIADFDGDSLPDFATVQPGPVLTARTSYWIHFNFSLGNQRSFEVSAPPGGLQLASRDVNGDSFLDLIISTRISNEPVAVLLNDGRGNFHLVHREAFSVGIWEAPSVWRSSATCQNDHEPAMASAGLSAAICSLGARTELQPAAARISPASQQPDSFVVLHDDRGRAPPAS